MSGTDEPGLSRQMGVLGLVATGVCSMMGVGIYVIPIMIQRNVPGVGPYVLLAYALAVVPALLAALAYAILASGMPRAGGSYVYVSRALDPYLGFVASFSQWFGLSIAIGVVSYVLIPFIRDIASTLELQAWAQALETGPVRVGLALAFLWSFTLVNIYGVKVYERALVPLMFLMFIGGLVVIPAGFYFDQTDFVAAVAAREGVQYAAAPSAPFDLTVVLAAAVILFSTFIGFDSIAQAGGEAKDPNRTLPLAIGISILSVGAYYMVFTAAMYHVVPWSFIAERAELMDLTAPGLLGYLLSPGWTVLIIAGAAIALINDLPAMLLAVSRLMFAWAKDGVFPRRVAVVNERWRTPHVAIVLSAAMASVGILGSHLAGDFFLGVDILVTAMLVNFFLACLAVLALPKRNPALAGEIRFVRSRTLQWVIGGCGALLLGALLVIQIIKDLRADVAAWYFHSTYVYLLVMVCASIVFVLEWRKLRRDGVDVKGLFRSLPPE
jgi:APA family basic amino acid/polyamine antiporter